MQTNEITLWTPANLSWCELHCIILGNSVIYLCFTLFYSILLNIVFGHRVNENKDNILQILCVKSEYAK